MPRKFLVLPPLEILEELFVLDSESPSGICYKETMLPAGRLKRNGYWYVSIKSKYYLCHRIVYFLINREDPGETFVDHAKRDSSININLRLATNAQNVMNTEKRKDKVYTSKYKGVSWHKGAKKWVAQFYTNGKSTYLGAFSTEEEAAIKYNEAVKNQWGEYAWLNEIAS